MSVIAAKLPWLVGGSADLGKATGLRGHLKMDDVSEANPGGQYVHFGCREHAMTSMLNGLALVGLRPFGAGFLAFSDYAKPSIRLGALMKLPIIHIYTHDSICVSEDGPTHQPVEQLAGLRAIPGLLTFRPADANEVAETWKLIINERNRPVALVLGRLPVPTIDRQRYASASGTAHGAYVLADSPGRDPVVLLLATGSEVALCLAAYELLLKDDIPARVISMPCWELFEDQSLAYRETVMPSGVMARVAVEQAAELGWSKYVSVNGITISMSTFGASGDYETLRTEFGFTVLNIYQAARKQILMKSSSGFAL
jgi:transketolase